VAPHLNTLYERWGVRPDWMDEGACRGAPSSLFYVDDDAAAGPAKEICGTCPVQVDCLAFALNNMKDATDAGVWGGTTARERRSIRRRTRRELEKRHKM